MISKSKFTQYSAAIVTAIAIFSAGSANAKVTRSCDYSVNGWVYYNVNGAGFKYDADGTTSARAVTPFGARRTARTTIVSQQTKAFKAKIIKEKAVQGTVTIDTSGDNGCRGSVKLTIRNDEL